MSSCAATQRKAKLIPYNGFNESSATPVKNAEVKVYREQYPKFVTLRNNVLEVAKGYENKVEILGRLESEIEWERGYSSINSIKKVDEMTNFDKYCFYNPILALPIPVIGIIFNPLAWPCFAMDHKAGDDREDADWREEKLTESLKEKAAKVGGNYLIGVNFGGKVTIDTSTGQQVSSSKAWSATGYVIKVK